MRNEVYVDMSELNFPTKLIRLTKATHTIVTCCVKIQNDCSESFETTTIFFFFFFQMMQQSSNGPWAIKSRQRLRQGYWPKGRRTNYSYLRERFSERYAARKSKMVSTGEGTTTNSIESLTALNVMKTNRLRYTGHMIGRSTRKSSIQSQTQWKEKPRKTEIQVGRWGEQR
jgi:hypothetical protein